MWLARSVPAGCSCPMVASDDIVQQPASEEVAVNDGKKAEPPAPAKFVVDGLKAHKLENYRVMPAGAAAYKFHIRPSVTDDELAKGHVWTVNASEENAKIVVEGKHAYLSRGVND